MQQTPRHGLKARRRTAYSVARGGRAPVRSKSSALAPAALALSTGGGVGATSLEMSAGTTTPAENLPKPATPPVAPEELGGENGSWDNPWNEWSRQAWG